MRILRPQCRPLRLAGLVAACLGLTTGLAPAQGVPDYELAPILYSERTPENRVSRLAAELSSRRPELSGKGFLEWFLREASVPIESQVLVFSKTSLQRDLITPERPRALFFSDDLYVGWVPGGLMEVAVSDPELGLVFYKLDSRPASGPMELQRDGDCLSCHGGSMTRNWPGLMLRSVFPDHRGEPITSAGNTLVGHDTPMEKRWGGWYVTGLHGTNFHLGNAIARPTDRGAELIGTGTTNLTRLDPFFQTTLYPRPDSDIVALMVMEHQVMMHDRLCEGGLRVRRWNHYQRQLQKELGEPPSEEPTGTALRVIRSETERILEVLLFCDEARLPEGGIRGAGDFERAFVANRPADEQGRSLRDFDLDTRLFRWRCSYMIYSEAFSSLPVELKKSVFGRLDEILSDPQPQKRFTHLADEERRAIREILLSTQPEFAEFLRQKKRVAPAEEDDRRISAQEGRFSSPGATPGG